MQGSQSCKARSSALPWLTPLLPIHLPGCLAQPLNCVWAEAASIPVVYAGRTPVPGSWLRADPNPPCPPCFLAVLLSWHLLQSQGRGLHPLPSWLHVQPIQRLLHSLVRGWALACWQTSPLQPAGRACGMPCTVMFRTLHHLCLLTIQTHMFLAVAVPGPAWPFPCPWLAARVARTRPAQGLPLAGSAQLEISAPLWP